MPAFLAEVVRLYGDRPAAIFGATGDRWSYAEFAVKIDALAAGLLALGVRKGDRVAPDELREWCRGKIAHYKIPRYVRMVDEFPLTATGKAQKFRMQETMAAELGLTG